MAICGLVFGDLHLRAWKALPRRLDAIMDEVYFHGEILTAPAENHAGTALLYVRTVVGGVGVFMVDLKTLARTQIASGKPANAERGKAVRLMGWSPDDRYLAFSTIQENDENQDISICDGRTGKVINSLEAVHSLEMGAWLDDNSRRLTTIICHPQQ